MEIKIGKKVVRDNPRHRALWPKQISDPRILPDRYQPFLDELDAQGRTLSNVIFVPQLNWWSKDRLEYMMAEQDDGKIILITRHKKGVMVKQVFDPKKIFQVDHTVALIDTSSILHYENGDGTMDAALFHYNSVTEMFFTEYEYKVLQYEGTEEEMLTHENPLRSEIVKFSYALGNYCNRAFLYDEQFFSYFYDETPRKEKGTKKNYRSVNEYFLMEMTRGLVYIVFEHALKKSVYTDWDAITKIALVREEKPAKALRKHFPNRNLFIRVTLKDGSEMNFPVREENAKAAAEYLRNKLAFHVTVEGA